MIDIPDRLLEYIRGYFNTNLSPHPDISGLSKRSWKQMLVSLGESNVFSQWVHIAENFSLHELLPTLEEWQEQHVLLQKAMGFPYYLLHISFSSPVIFPKRLSVSSLLKLYDKDKRLQVRIKMSGFTDTQGLLWWEVGFVHTSKSLDTTTTSLPQRQSYYMLSRLVANTYKFIQKRTSVNGIHLSPAFYHIWPLSLRIASQYSKTIIEKVPVEWMQQLNEACANMGEFSHLKMNSKSQRQFHISRMLEKQQILHPKTGAILYWQPPAIIILR